MSHPSRDPAALAAALRVELDADRRASGRGRNPAPAAGRELSEGAKALAARHAARNAHVAEPLRGILNAISGGL